MEKRTRLRRATQVAVLLLFIGLVLAARPQPGQGPAGWLSGFFLADPLLLLLTGLAAHAVPVLLWLSLVTVVITALLGRVFCGWFCPLGTVHAAVVRAAERLQGRERPIQHWTRWHRVKYYVLFAFLGEAIFGGHWGTLWDPLVLLYRTTVTSLLPAAQWAVETGATTVYQSDPHLGALHLTALTEPTYRFLRDHVWGMPRQAFVGTAWILVFFVAILAANVWRPRFWCRCLCPLGALLGLIARYSVVRRQVEPERCDHCDLCALGCHGAATDPGGRRWRPSECLVCLHCTEDCPQGAVGFQRLAFRGKEPPAEGSGVSRRVALAALVGGMGIQAAFRATPQGRGRVYSPRLIRPPGARSEPDFLARCTACGLCMKVCPTGGLQPAVGQTGLEGLWTPVLVPRLGYCAYDCTACGDGCPTGAIVPLELRAKHQIRIGLAAFDTTRCIPYAYGRDCMVCQEHCPIPDKAIYFLEALVRDRNGRGYLVKQPYVDADLCTGCGNCENVCVLRDQPGIRVFSANESRHPDNQPILPQAGSSAHAQYPSS